MARYIDADILYSVLEEKYKFSSGKAHKAYGLALDCICAFLIRAEAEAALKEQEET